MVLIGGPWPGNNKQEDRRYTKLKQNGLNALTYVVQAALRHEVELRNVQKQEKLDSSLKQKKSEEIQTH